jgi:hypothetical protein
LRAEGDAVQNGARLTVAVAGRGGRLDFVAEDVA